MKSRATSKASDASRITGKLIVNPRGFGFIEPTTEEPSQRAESGGGTPASEEDALFVPPKELGRFLSDDVVSAAVVESGSGRRSARDLVLEERARTELFGKVVGIGKERMLRVDRRVCAVDWPLSERGRTKVAEGTSVVAEIVDGQKAKPIRAVREVDESLERVVVRYELRTEFPADVEREAQTIASRVRSGVRGSGVEVRGRRDLRGMPTVTIDAPVSRDLDDALSVLPADPDGAVRLFVSIADVDAWVPLGSKLDLEARERATSVYLAGRVLPMLPRSLSEEALSLLPGHDRFALTVELRIDPEGEVTSIDLYESVIRSTARLSYTGVAALMDEGREDEIPNAVRSTVRWLRTAAARLATVRAARGGVELLREEAYVTLDPSTGEPTDLDLREDTSANKLIERLMVAANEAVATWITDRGLPGVYRVHDEPDGDQVVALTEGARNLGFETGLGTSLSARGLASLEQQFKHTAVSAAMYSILGRALGPARYTVHPSAHFGLGSERYLHFTSPIRRYADLTVHRVVKGFLHGQRDRYAGEEAIEELSGHLNDAAARATWAENERLRMLAARLFAGRVGQRYRGNIIDVRSFGLIVQLAGTGVAGSLAVESLPGGPYRLNGHRHALVSSTRTLSIGQPLDVVISATDEELGRIELSLATEPAPTTAKRRPRQPKPPEAPAEEPKPKASKRKRSTRRR